MRLRFRAQSVRKPADSRATSEPAAAAAALQQVRRRWVVCTHGCWLWSAARRLGGPGAGRSLPSGVPPASRGKKLTTAGCFACTLLRLWGADVQAAEQGFRRRRAGERWPAEATSGPRRRAQRPAVVWPAQGGTAEAISDRAACRRPAGTGCCRCGRLRLLGCGPVSRRAAGGGRLLGRPAGF